MYAILYISVMLDVTCTNKLEINLPYTFEWNTPSIFSPLNLKINIFSTCQEMLGISTQYPSNIKRMLMHRLGNDEQ